MYILIVILVIVILVGIIIHFLAESNIRTSKGHYYEELVNKEILQLSEEYFLFNDLLFEINGYSTQIDHLVVSPYGIFVIETKGYSGLIFGGENSLYWTKLIYRRKYKFYNPIKQNAGHVVFLYHMLRCLTDIPFITIVAFSDNSELKVHANNSIVVNISNLKSAILQHRKSVLNKDTIDWIIQTISQNRIVLDKDKLKKHNYNVKYRQVRSINDINKGICPQCGGLLILRQGRYGSFYGCSNYPKCNLTLK